MLSGNIANPQDQRDDAENTRCLQRVSFKNDHSFPYKSALQSLLKINFETF